MSDGSSILLAIASTAVGSAASWFISRWYYRRSGSDLDTALRPLAGNDQKLLRAMNAIGRKLEQAGTGRLTYDQLGNVTGFALDVVGTLGAVASPARVSFNAMVTPPPRYDRQHEQPPPDEQGSSHA